MENALLRVTHFSNADVIVTSGATGLASEDEMCHYPDIYKFISSSSSGEGTCIYTFAKYFYIPEKSIYISFENAEWELNAGLGFEKDQIYHNPKDFVMICPKTHRLA